MKSSVKINKLTKKFKNKIVLRNISIELPKTGIFGILGKFCNFGTPWGGECCAPTPDASVGAAEVTLSGQLQFWGQLVR